MKKSYFIRYRLGDNNQSATSVVIDVTFPVNNSSFQHSELTAKEKLKLINEALADEIGEEVERILDGRIVILVLSAI